MRWEPVGEVENHAGKVSGFRDAEKAADGVKLQGSADEGGAARDDAPGNEHTADPDASADPVEDDVAGDCEEEVSEEEYAGAEAVDAVTEFEVADHLQFGEADVHAIDVGNDVGDEQDRHDAPGDLAIEQRVSADGEDGRRAVTSWRQCFPPACVLRPWLRLQFCVLRYSSYRALVSALGG